VNVDELQLHLSNLAQLLRNAGGKKVGDELAELCQRLQPYRDRPLKGLMELLDKAEEIVRTGVPPARTKSRAPKVDPQLVESTCNRVVALYERATDPSTTREQIESAFADLDKLNLTVPQLQEQAKRLNITQKFRAKKDLLHAMKRTVLERRGTFLRVQV
jgi:hypothetical protein